MVTFNVLPPFPVFFGRDGKPLEAGYVFIGELNQNPEDEEQEKAIFWDAALTIPAAQPVRTIGGYPSRAGSPSQVFVDGKFSLTVRDKNMQMVYTVGDAAALNPDAILTAADVVLAEAAAAIAVAAAVDAETAKDGAETAETNAAASAAAAATSETNAETAEDNAAASAAAALVSEGNAAASETATEALFEDFDTRYLGAKASAPTLDNEGNALQTGAVYFNSTSDTLFVWDGAAWSPAVFDTAGALFAANNLSDVANAATARANIGLQYASEAEAEAGTSNIRAMTPLRTADAIAALRPVSTDPDFSVDPTSLADRDTIADYIPAALNASGSAPIYACRAWVNFNGTGTVAIRASGNVSSITDNATGDYTLNFTTAMPDADYSFVGSANRDPRALVSTMPQLLTTTSARLRVVGQSGSSSADTDSSTVCVAIFR
jgi:hypothetical protein